MTRSGRPGLFRCGAHSARFRSQPSHRRSLAVTPYRCGGPCGHGRNRSASYRPTRSGRWSQRAGHSTWFHRSNHYCLSCDSGFSRSSRCSRHHYSSLRYYLPRKSISRLYLHTRHSSRSPAPLTHGPKRRRRHGIRWLSRSLRRPGTGTHAGSSIGRLRRSGRGWHLKWHRPPPHRRVRGRRKWSCRGRGGSHCS